MLKTTNELLALRLGALLFGLIGIVQLWRLFSHTVLILGTTFVPFWVSGVAAVIALCMAFLFVRVLRELNRPTV